MPARPPPPSASCTTRASLTDRRGPRRRRHDGLDGPGAGARHHDHVRRDDVLLEQEPDQHHRHPRARRLHRRGGAFAPRPRRRGRRVRRQGGRRAPVRDGVAPGRQVRRAAHLLRQQDGQARRRLLLHGRHDHQPPRRQAAGHPAAHRLRRRLRGRHRPGGDARAHVARRLQGRRRARCEVRHRGDPRGSAGQGGRVPGQAARDRRRDRRRAAREVLRRRGADGGGDQGRHPQAHRQQRDLPGALRLRVQEPRRPADARRGDRLPPQPARRAAHGGPRRARRGEDHHPQARLDRALLGARVQGRGAPVLRSPHVRPGLLGHHRERLAGHQLDQGQEGAHREDLPDALQQGEPGRLGHRRSHLRGHRPQGHDHGRHALRPAGTRSSSSR